MITQFSAHSIRVRFQFPTKFRWDLNCRGKLYGSFLNLLQITIAIFFCVVPHFRPLRVSLHMEPQWHWVLKSVCSAHYCIWWPIRGKKWTSPINTLDPLTILSDQSQTTRFQYYVTMCSYTASLVFRRQKLDNNWLINCFMMTAIHQQR